VNAVATTGLAPISVNLIFAVGVGVACQPTAE
jgi:hypothetical protein